MGEPFKVKVKVAAPTKDTQVPNFEEIELLVDSGATYTSLPTEMLNRLGIPVFGKIKLTIANGQTMERDYGMSFIQVEGRWCASNIVFSHDADIPVLGMNTLDEAGMAIDPIKKRLVPVQALQVTRILK